MFSFLVLFVRTVSMTNLVGGASSGLRRIVCWRLSLRKVAAVVFCTMIAPTTVDRKDIEGRQKMCSRKSATKRCGKMLFLSL